MRGFEVGQVGAREFAQLVFSRVGVGFEHYKSVRRLAPAFVRQADDRYFLHRRMSEQHAFDFD